jgi:glycosyltransferase involved in cell wall biosynthesis
MKIAFVVHNIIRGNGQGRIQYEIVRHLLEKGHAVTLFADAVAPEVVEWGARWIRIANVPRRPSLLGNYRYAAAADRMIARVRDEFEIIVGAGFTLREPHDASICQFVHGAWLRSPVHVSRVTHGPRAWYQYVYSVCNSKLERQSYAATRKIIAPSRKIVDELISIGVPAGKIELIYNGVDLEEFQPGVVSRRTLGLPEDVPLALFVGDIRTPRKNLDSVLKALVQLPQVHLAVVGAIPGSPFPAMAQTLGIANRVHFVGFRSNVNQFMQACDLFVFPSRYEAGTLVLIEALASGLPIVTARTAGGCEIMTPECGEILEDPDDFQAMAKAIDRLLLLKHAGPLKCPASRQVAERYDWRDMAAKYLEVFGELGAELSLAQPNAGLARQAAPTSVGKPGDF